MQRLVGDLG